MLLHVAGVLTADELAHCRQQLVQAGLADGNISAGHRSAPAAGNLQLPEDSPEARALGQLVLDALARNTTFFAGALPRHIDPPRFHGHRGDGSLGLRVDSAIRYDRSGSASVPIRTDISATLFLNDPHEYEGGALVIEDAFGAHTVKLAAGDMILYPASSQHRVEAVTRGERLVSLFWIQSLVRDEQRRRMLLELDVSIQSLTQAHSPHSDVLRLTGIYHNLLRIWSET
ncbi:Fe2+-dependent dioxygenase [Dyella sp. ASV21]|uniref:Fe2+-dependent dioxygenase n=1 Tax=Dyella sp. ASV21 TaxID=2795114 RepID=UPI0018EA7B5F|nr:Fe2+-dependent dioxygenase [Dyella sp. ASV21]